MRHLTKRLLSGFLALIMLYSCVGTVFATLVTDGYRNYGYGRASGKSSNEGIVTEGKVNVVLPTVAVDFYNFLLDPEGAIVKTGAADHAGVVDYDEGKLYFKNQNVDGKGGIALYHNSDPLTVINKGTVPVNVRLSLVADKGSYGFDFSDQPKLKDEAGNPLDGNTMYLAAVSGRRFSPVQEWEELSSGGEIIAGSVNAAVLNVWVNASGEGLHNVEWDAVNEAYRYVPRRDVPDSAFENFSFFVTGQISGTNWAQAAAEGAIGLSLVWDVTESAYDEFPYDQYPDPDVEPSAKPKTRTCTSGETVILLVDLGCGADNRPMRSIDNITYQKKDGSAATLNLSALRIEDLDANATRVTFDAPAAYSKRVTFVAPADMIAASDWKIHFTDKTGAAAEAAFDPRTLEPVVKVVEKAKLAGDTVKLDVHYGLEDSRYPGVYQIEYTAKEGYPAALASVTQSGKSTVTFDTNVPLLEGENWQLVLYREDASGERETYPLDLGKIFAPSERARDPSAKVTRVASAPGDRVALSVDYGAGLGWYPNVDKIVFTKEDGSEGEVGKSAITVSDTSVSFTATQDVISGDGWRLQLSNKAGDTFQIPLNIFSTATPTPSVSPTPTMPNRPSAVGEIDPKATQAGDTIVIPVDWGSGDNRMTSIAEVRYKTPDNKEVSITSETYLYSVGSDVMLKFTVASIKGHDFELVLRDTTGKYSVFPIDPIEEGYYAPTTTPTPLSTPTPVETPTNTPTPTGVNRPSAVRDPNPKATQAGDTVVIPVDWGSGEQRMTSLVEVRYKTPDNKDASVSSETYLTAAGNEIRFKFTTASIKGHDFEVVLRNTKGNYSVFPVNLIEEAYIAPTLTPTNTPTPKPLFTPTNTPTPVIASLQSSVGEIDPKATQAGDIVTIPVDWGSGESRMTSVVEVRYKTPDNKDASISSETYLYSNGNDVMLKFTVSSIKGHDFELVLRDSKGNYSIFPIDPIEEDYIVPTVTPTNTPTPKPLFTPTNTPTPTVANRPAAVSDPDPKARQAGDTVAIPVDWGSGDNRMTSVAEVRYKTPDNKDASISSGTYLTVNGSEINLKFTTTSIKGHDFEVVLRDTTGKYSVFPVNLIEEGYVAPTLTPTNTPTPKPVFTPTNTPTPTPAYREPSATVTTKASKAGDTAVIAVDWGTGEGRMTSVKEIKYTNTSNKVVSVNSSTYLKTSGSNVTFKFTVTTIKGTNFILVLRNTSGKTYEIPVDLIG